VLLLGGAVLAAEIVMSGRTRKPVLERAAALAAYEEASGEPAARFAPDEMKAADEALRDALFQYSRQESRLFVLRDFRPAAAAFGAARAAAIDAERQGDARRDDALAVAAEAVQKARVLEAHALALVAVTTLPPAQRTHLQSARLAVREAQAHLDGGDAAKAEERARQAEAELRMALGPALAAAERYTAKDQVAIWRRWIEETRRHSLLTGEPAILVLKEKNLLILLARGEPARSYAAEVGANALGVKRQKGDRATPEGRYRVVEKKDVGRSTYHRALLLDYPNAADRERFAAEQRRGEIPRGAAIGGLIEIHGDGGRGQNWTDGCIALANGDMDDLYRRVAPGTRVTIVGGDGSDGAFSSLLAKVKEPGEGS
jgi:lipoprotein-anchoring transpeptidase ErfK/SrfK